MKWIVRVGNKWVSSPTNTLTPFPAHIAVIENRQQADFLAKFHGGVVEEYVSPIDVDDDGPIDWSKLRKNPMSLPRGVKRYEVTIPDTDFSVQIVASSPAKAKAKFWAQYKPPFLHAQVVVREVKSNPDLLTVLSNPGRRKAMKLSYRRRRKARRSRARGRRKGSWRAFVRKHRRMLKKRGGMRKIARLWRKRMR